MMSDVPPLSSATPLIGRAGELDRLTSLIGLPTPGQAASAVLLSGDAGVGKTRLLVELRDLAEDAGWRVVAGHCLDFGDSALPYLPFTEAFGRLAVDAPALVEAIAEDNPAIRRLLPGRRLLSGGGHAEPDSVDRADLFEAVYAALERLGQAGPTLLVVEDVHWADQSTREMLSFLFSRPFLSPVALVASYRSDDLHRRHPLRRTAAEWARLPGVARMPLPPLSDPDVRRLVRSIHPARLPEMQMRAIVTRAEGIAFFVEELVGAAGSGGQALPADLAELLLVRLERLDDQARATVRAAAAAGRRVPHALLARVVGLPADALDQALRAAVESHVLVPAGDDAYAFRHALLAEAVYDDLLPGERVRLHTAYVDALSRRDVEGTAAELARHARAANNPVIAVQASIEAGDDAMAVGGPDEAAQHYEQALSLCVDPRAEGPGEPVDLVGLSIKAADAHASAGDPLRALKLLEDQLSQVTETAGEPRLRLLLALGQASLLADTSVNPLEMTTQALAMLDESPTKLRAKVLTAHARANAAMGRDDDALRWATEARTLSERLGMPRLVNDATTTLAKLDQKAGDPLEAQRSFEKIVAQARADGDLTSELRGLFHLASLHFEAGQLEEARAVFEGAADRAAAAGRPWTPFGLDARVLAALCAYVLGDWAATLRLSDVSDAATPALPEALLNAVALGVHAGRGDEGGLELLAEVRPWWDKDGLIALTSAAAGIDLLGDAGDVEAALRLHDEVVEAVGQIWQNPWFQARIRLCALALGQIGSHVAQVGSAERDELVARAEELVAAGHRTYELVQRRPRPFGPEGLAWLARLDAEAARVHWLTGISPPSEAELHDAWRLAEARFAEFGHVFELARTRARLAAVLRAQGETAEARELVAQANESARRLDAEPLRRELRSLGGPGPSRAGDGAAQHETLTPRELEILTLVAQGRTNGDIARQLFISPKTVSVHVSNILAKLGAAGRTEAAALARQRQLIPD
jgi:DNA-binding CsgD family transcriptional regulator